MFKKNQYRPTERRPNSEWLAYGLAGLIVLITAPQLWSIALALYYSILAPQLGDAWFLVYAVCGLCMVIAFYALVVIFTLAPRFILFKIITGKRR